MRGILLFLATISDANDAVSATVIARALADKTRNIPRLLSAGSLNFVSENAGCWIVVQYFLQAFM